MDAGAITERGIKNLFIPYALSLQIDKKEQLQKRIVLFLKRLKNKE
ncbi:MAG: hypothetical protein GQ532_19355 [Methylomarinum sp.]|nr:hypothetical protein [Methylomarinum sp.]